LTALTAHGLFDLSLNKLKKPTSWISTKLKKDSYVSNTPIKLTVIGGGPGGYTAAFLAADLDMDVTLIDQEVGPGGVCLHRGCIPSKALLHAAKVLSESREAKEIGITFAKPVIDIDKLRQWKNGIITRQVGGLMQLCKQRKIRHVQGKAKFLSSTTLEIQRADGSKESVAYDKAILATGSRPITLPFAPQSARVLDSTGALNLENVPKNLLVIGGGYIGLELGTVYAELGSEVSVVEMTPGLLPGADRDLANVLSRRAETIFKSIMLNTKVTKIEDTSKSIRVTFEQDGKTISEEYEKVLISIGRRPNSQDLGLENTKVEIDPKGFVKINGQRQTTDPSIYAIGDIAGEPMLAHKASHEGRVAVEAIAGHKVAFEPNAIPAVVFTDPEIAWCGLTETQAEKEGRTIEVVKFPWGASGRAVTLNRTDGLTKLIVDPTTHRILGMAIVGVGAGELISEGVLAVEMGTVVSDLKLTIHPHPTTSETVMEAAESFFGQSTHFYRPKKK
jgi:dihydrolipoamide dehydrogenase